MKVEAEVKIKILDGEEEGKICTFKTVGETYAEHHTEYGVVECLNLGWRYIHNMPSVKQKGENK